eukprot:6423703-Alexandrium_andersonii.AAC.1
MLCDGASAIARGTRAQDATAERARIHALIFTSCSTTTVQHTRAISCWQSAQARSCTTLLAHYLCTACSASVAPRSATPRRA